MLFWLVVIALVLFTVIALLTNNKWECDSVYVLSTLLAICAAVAIVIMLVVICVTHFGADGYVAKMNQRYDMLVYQYENDIYDNDNDLGKRELMSDIQSWNEDLARYKEVQDDFWIGIFTPNVYDQFEFIELKEE